MMYKRFCSLGWNCEPGLALRSAGYPERMDYFKWSATKFDALCDIIDNDFADAYNADNLEIVGEMVRDVRYGVSTHKPSEKYFKGYQNEYDLFNYIDQDKKRRGLSFIEELRGVHPIAYILTYIGSNGSSDAKRIRDLFCNKGVNPGSRIIFIQEQIAFEPPWGERGIDNLYISSLAPYENVWALKREEWERLLRSYDVADSPGSHD